MTTWNKYANFARTKISTSDLDAGVLSVTVVNDDEFPSTFPFFCTIWDADNYPDATNDISGREIVKVTASPSANTYTIERGQNGTSDIDHLVGESFALCIYAEDMEAIQDEVDDILSVVSGTEIHATAGSFGDETNYSSWDETGHQEMVGDAKPWEDLRIEPVARTIGTYVPTFEKWFDDVGNASRGVYLYSFDDAAVNAEKEVFFTMQMPHAWDGGPISIHVHWVASHSDTNAVPRWGLEYNWADIGSAFGDTVIVYSNALVPAGNDITANLHYISEFADITPSATQDGLSSIFIGRLFRNSSDSGDTYNVSGNKCGLLYIDAHYQLSSIGSDEEYIK